MFKRFAVIGLVSLLAATQAAAQESTPIPVVVTVVFVFPTHTPTPEPTATLEPTAGPSPTATATVTPTPNTLVNSSVEIDGISQDVGIRYEVDAGQVAIVIMLFIIACLLVIDGMLRLKKS